MDKKEKKYRFKENKNQIWHKKLNKIIMIKLKNNFN